MATIQKFEDLKVWQKARGFPGAIYPLTFTEPVSSDLRFKDQIRGSIGSIMDNIAESFERGSKLEFINALSTSKESRRIIISIQFDVFYNLVSEITKMLTTLINYLNKSKFKGQKFKDRT